MLLLLFLLLLPPVLLGQAGQGQPRLAPVLLPPQVLLQPVVGAREAVPLGRQPRLLRGGQRGRVPQPGSLFYNVN